MKSQNESFLVYKITNKINGKIYVGQTTRMLDTRIKEHTYADTPLGEDIRKYGITNFTIEILTVCLSVDQLSELEKEYIEKLNCRVPNGYNQFSGVEILQTKSASETFSNRRDEIISACAKLYQNFSFKEITLQKIGDATTFTRTSIYNYFHTKEEIFLALLQREYELWIEELDAIEKNYAALTREEFADKLAKSLENRVQLLKLMSMNHYDMESNSRLENLIEFKKSYGNSLNAVKRCLEKFFPNMTEPDKENFLYAFFPFIYGIYPYAIVTDKQRDAMLEANTNYVYHTIYELAYNCVKKLLGEN